MTRWLAIAALLVGADQLSKLAVLRLMPANGIEVTPFFNLILVYNRGAAFSFLSSAGGWQREFFITIAIVAAVWILHLLHRYRERVMFCAALSLILGGAIGNVIDRFVYGAVVDFLDLHAYGWHWPAFNIADSAITCGAILLIWEGFRRDKESTASAGSG